MCMNLFFFSQNFIVLRHCRMYELESFHGQAYIYIVSFLVRKVRIGIDAVQELTQASHMKMMLYVHELYCATSVYFKDLTSFSASSLI